MFSHHITLESMCNRNKAPKHFAPSNINCKQFMMNLCSKIEQTKDDDKKRRRLLRKIFNWKKILFFKLLLWKFVCGTLSMMCFSIQRVENFFSKKDLKKSQQNSQTFPDQPISSNFLHQFAQGWFFAFSSSSYLIWFLRLAWRKNFCFLI